MGDASRRNIASAVIFWLFAGLCVAALALGWAIDQPLFAAFARVDLVDLHVSLGLSAAIALLAYFLVGVARNVVFGGGAPTGRQAIGFWLRQLLILAFAGTGVAGILALAVRGEQIFFWRYPLPVWDAGDISLSEPLLMGHRYAAYFLAGVILVYLLFTIYVRLSPALPAQARALEPLAPATLARMIADGLAHSFRFFGGAAFWVQLLLGIVSALLLAFGFVGHSVSPGRTSFSDAIYWATAGLGLLIFCVLFAFKYMRTAKRIRSQPTAYLGYEKPAAFWFVGLGGLFSIMGVLVSFVGVGLSVALLIGKTVSQPPGIAITDPQKIVRALDIFILLVNFNLLFAHFIGFGVAAWLSISAWKARHQYLLPINTSD